MLLELVSGLLRGASAFNVDELIPLALLFYDYLTTFPGEVRRIWSRGHVGITLLYAGTRYGALAARLIFVLAQTSWKGQNYLVRSFIASVSLALLIESR